MIIVHCAKKQEYYDAKERGIYGEQYVEAEGFLHFSTWNSFHTIASSFKDVETYVLCIVESETVQAPILWEDGGEGILYPHMYGTLLISQIQKVIPLSTYLHEKKTCVHVLMNHSSIDYDWCYTALKSVIQPSMRVCVLALSFFDNIQSANDWDAAYCPSGMWYASIMKVWKRYGIREDQITWVNYFKDTPKEMHNKVLNSDIVFLLGGAPDLMMQRIMKCKLDHLLAHYRGVMIGYSAGAMIQLANYHITPDADYAIFSYEKGLPILYGFDIEVHYTNSLVQLQAIKKVQEEKDVRIYAIYDDGGMIIQGENVEMFGHVDVFEPSM